MGLTIYCMCRFQPATLKNDMAGIDKISFADIDLGANNKDIDTLLEFRKGPCRPHRRIPIVCEIFRPDRVRII